MSFLNPIMLAGLAAIAVPIIIHFLNRHRARRVSWAAMRFLRASIEQNRRRLQIEDWVLLVLRCALIVLIALALARPSFSGGAGLLADTRSTTVIILDNSMSLGVTVGGISRFERGRRAAEETVNRLPSRSSAAFWAASDVVEPLVPEPSSDLGLVRRWISKAQLSDRSSDLLPALSRAFDVLRARTALRKEVFLITDAQALAWRQWNELLQMLAQMRGEVAVHVLFVDDDVTNNVAISDLHFSGGVPVAGQPMRFSVRVTNHGAEMLADVRVTLQVEQEPPSDEFVIPALAAGASHSTILFGKVQEPGFRAFRARIANDQLRADDERAWVLPVAKELPVLIVDGASGTRRESGSYFLRYALAPIAAGEKPPISIDAIPISQLADTSLQGYEVVIFAGVSALPDGTAARLRQHLSAGNGAMIFPAPDTDPLIFNQQFGSVLPATLGMLDGNSTSEAEFITLAGSPYDHPIVEIWNDPASGSLSSIRFFQRFTLNSPSARVVLHYVDGPAIVESSIGRGRVLLFTSTADTSWNDWPVRPSFVPFMHRALAYLVEARHHGLNLRVGEPLARQVAADFLQHEISVQPPLPGVPGQRTVTMIDGAPVLRFEGTDLAGVYGMTSSQAVFDERFAVQPDALESNLSPLSTTQIDKLANVANVVRWSGGRSLALRTAGSAQVFELSLPLLILGSLTAVVELVCSQWFSRSR